MGQLETRKCVDKMYTLRAKQAGKTEFEQHGDVGTQVLKPMLGHRMLRYKVRTSLRRFYCFLNSEVFKMIGMDM